MTFSARTQFTLPQAQPAIDHVGEHLAGHGVEMHRDGQQTHLSSTFGSCTITIDGDQVTMEASSSSLTGLAVVREELAGHLIEHVPDLADRIVWRGDGSDVTQPVWFCLLTVVSTTRLTPHMQRIRFSGSNLERYAGLDDIHVRLMLPLHPDQPPQWPSVEASGVTHYPTADILAIRKYTIRDIDPVSGFLDIDFVLHEDAGPGSDFAGSAQPGAVIGLGGPGGSSAPLDRDWYLFAGDETALPAIARLLERLPPGARGTAFIEVDGLSEQQQLKTPSGFDIRWLHRNGAEAGTTDLLLDAVRTMEIAADRASSFAWVGCEHQSAMAIKTLLRKERDWNKQDDLIVSYWRRAVPGAT